VTIDQVDPFHRSTNALTPTFVTAVPTAKQYVRLTHDTETSRLCDASDNVGVIDQPVAFHLSANDWFDNVRSS
jgi:hypothetical protein